jgi:hypothetical protein
VPSTHTKASIIQSCAPLAHPIGWQEHVPSANWLIRGATRTGAPENTASKDSTSPTGRPPGRPAGAVPRPVTRTRSGPRPRLQGPSAAARELATALAWGSRRLNGPDAFWVSVGQTLLWPLLWLGAAAAADMAEVGGWAHPDAVEATLARVSEALDALDEAAKRAPRSTGPGRARWRSTRWIWPATPANVRFVVSCVLFVLLAQPHMPTG